MVLLSAKTNDKELEIPSSNWELLHYFRKKLSRNFTDYGLWISWKKAMAYLLRPLYQKVIYYIYELELNKYVSQRAQNSKFIFRLIRHDEDNLIDQIEGMEEWLGGALKNKLQHNCLCMVVLDGDRVIGFNYAAIGEGNIPLLKLRVLTRPTEAWSEQITISSDYRQQGLASALRNHFYQELRAKGITTMYGHRQEFNIASKQSARKYTRDVMVRAEYKRTLGIHRLKCIKGLPGEPEDNKYFYIKPHWAKSAKGANHIRSKSDTPLFTAWIEDLK
jgi:GNAT superfamily N-acetyltransferase